MEKTKKTTRVKDNQAEWNKKIKDLFNELPEEYGASIVIYREIDSSCVPNENCKGCRLDQDAICALHTNDLLMSLLINIKGVEQASGLSCQEILKCVKKAYKILGKTQQTIIEQNLTEGN